MADSMWVFFGAALLFRLGMLAVSVGHERRLRAEGAVEFGAKNTLLLALVHAGFYVSAGVEGWWRGVRLDGLAWVGMGIYLVSAGFLVLVVRLLGRFWTVKLMLARDHVLVDHPLFRRVRHPNYFLNILPELLGLGLAMHAFWTLGVGLPVYLVPLVVRIRQEEVAMRERFVEYGARMLES